MDERQKLILIKYFQSPKKYDVINIRENEVLAKILERLMQKYNLDSKQKVIELAVLSIALRMKPDELAPFLAIRTRSSKKVLAKFYEMLYEYEASEASTTPELDF